MKLLSNERPAKTEARVRLSSLVKNYRAVSACTDRPVMCVVKADAYGHGAVRCVRALAAEGVRNFAVSSVAEAEEVRLALPEECREDTRILILGYTLPEDIDLLIRYHIAQNVFSEEYALALEEARRDAAARGVIGEEEKLTIHIKIDTGMNRLGFSPDDTDAILRVCEMPGFEPEGIFTHFAEADDPASDATEKQFSRLEGCMEKLAARGRTFSVRHACNSAAITMFPRAHLDMVRLGIELYGLVPSAETVLPEGLLPVMTLVSVISHIHIVHAGEKIGYGGTYSPDHDIRIATVPVGYADGFLRAYAKGTVKIREKDVPILGRICMDQCMVDVTDIPDAAVGNEVLLFGEGTQSADDIAKKAGTIGYEVVCAVGKRVPRVYL